MPERSWVRTCLKWFAILWTVAAIAIVVISNIMILSGWQAIAGVPPFNVRDNVAVALLLAPGAVAVLIDWMLFRRTGDDAKQ
jgi:hypothetical protein